MSDFAHGFYELIGHTATFGKILRATLWKIALLRLGLKRGNYRKIPSYSPLLRKGYCAAAIPAAYSQRLTGGNRAAIAGEWMLAQVMAD
ncbi:hypothetical protein [Synechococcus elongatus]|uniref:Uncharacterized protein n=1 Tax=Synechococcus elongatus PCC 11801 TaxID=2219813 RepID=A0AAN1QNK0_SYNEL|nr:hypothetical protein DOP62_06885 [Synechococcus elongatus PCC 11801]